MFEGFTAPDVETGTTTSIGGEQGGELAVAGHGADEERAEMERQRQPEGEVPGEDQRQRDQRDRLRLDHSAIGEAGPPGDSQDGGQEIGGERDHPQQRQRGEIGGDVRGDREQQRGWHRPRLVPAARQSARWRPPAGSARRSPGSRRGSAARDRAPARAAEDSPAGPPCCRDRWRHRGSRDCPPGEGRCRRTTAATGALAAMATNGSPSETARGPVSQVTGLPSPSGCEAARRRSAPSARRARGARGGAEPGAGGSASGR